MKFSNIFSSKNSNCNCSKYYDVENSKDLEERIKKTTRIISNLKLIEKLENLQVSLYECRICGQLWQESLSWMHGNSKYIFEVPKIETKHWKESPFIEPHKIFLFTGSLIMYFDRGKFEEKEEKCKKDDCENHAIKLSVFCILHQMENIGISLDPPTGYKWFHPYEKEKLLINMAVIKQHPNYEALKK